MAKNPPARAGDTVGVSWLWVGKIPGGGKGNPLQYSCLDNTKDRGARWATARGSKRDAAECARTIMIM